MSTLPQLEEKIYSIVPELKELTFGCEVKYYWDSFRGQQISDFIFLYQSDEIVVYLDKNVPTDSPEYRLKIFVKEDMCEEDFEIIGHEIHPHHWLPLLGEKYPFAMDCGGQIMQWVGYDSAEEYTIHNLPRYDFKKSFKDQSPEFHEWLLSQLPK